MFVLLLSGDKLSNYLIGLTTNFPDIYLRILDKTVFFLFQSYVNEDANLTE